jgi:hypothetical protein
MHAREGRADDVGPQSFVHGAAHEVEIKVAGGVVTSKSRRALWLRALRKQFAFLVDDRRPLRRIAMVMMSPGRSVGDFAHGDRRVADVNHGWRARRLAGFDREPQRGALFSPIGLPVQPYFDADADVAVVADRLRGAVESANPS